MLVNFYRFFTLANEQRRQKELQGSILPKKITHTGKRKMMRAYLEF